MKQILLFLALFAVLAANVSAQEKLPALASPAVFQAFATSNCLTCHDSKRAEGGFDLEDLLKGKNVSAGPAAWHSALERIVSRDMPPKNAKARPTEDEYRKAEDWIRDQLRAHEAIAAAARPRPMRRLNRDEYNHTIQQVFGLPELFPADDFPPDDATDGFTNVGEGLNLSAVLVEQYLKAGEMVSRLAVADGPKPAGITRVYTIGSMTPATAIQGISNSINMVEGKWVSGELSVKVAQAPPGFYKVRLTATANLADRPDYIPNFRYQANERVVFQADSPIREGKLSQEFDFAHTQGNLTTIAFNWGNGFSANGQGRAYEHRQPEWTERQAYTRKNVANFMAFEYRPARKDNPDLPFPIPHLTEVKIEVEGPLFPDGWPMSRFQRENAVAFAKKDAKAIAEWLLPRLFRRPAKAEEIKDFVAFVAKSEAELADAKPQPIPVDQRFPAAIRLAVQRALVSPHFLFLVEPGPVGRGLSDHELAVRISYFLWSASPDEELTKLANAGKLRPALSEQAKRMLADPRSKAFVDRFTTEWLGLDKLPSIMPEPELYPRFDPQNFLRHNMAAEPKALMAHLLKENGSLYDLLDSDYAMLNDRLADHYHLPSLWTLFPLKLDGFTPISGGDFRKVKLPDDRRGGLVTSAAFLALTSENTRTSPVKRGVWVLEKLFNRTPPPPPPNVNGALPDTTGGTTAAEKLKLHRNAANCAGCHARIDPFGLALENYDVIGEWRDREPPYIDPANPSNNQAAVREKLKLKKYDPLPTFSIDVTFRMGDFEGKGPAGLKQYLVANKEKFARGFSEKLLTYALGRRHLITDEPELARIRETAMKDQFRLQTLIVALVDSPLFQAR
jgi:hypothetical protein